MSSTGHHGECLLLGTRFGPMAKSLTAQKLVRKIAGGSGQTPLGNSRVNLTKYIFDVVDDNGLKDEIKDDCPCGCCCRRHRSTNDFCPRAPPLAESLA